MPIRLFQSSLARLKRLFGSTSQDSGQRGLPFAQAWVMAPFPALADSSVIAGHTLITALAGLGIFAGISAGLLYRQMHDQADQLAARARRTEAELRALLTLTDDAILILDAHGAIRAVNPAAEELFARETEAMIERNFNQLLPQKIAFAEQTRHGPASHEAVLRRPGKPDAAIELHLSRIELAGEPNYLILASEKAAPAPAAIVQSDLSRPVLDFCHDLNNQLTTVLGNLSLLLMHPAADTAKHNLVIGAKKTALRAQQLSRELQRLARGPEASTETAATPAPGTIVPMPLPPEEIPTAPCHRDGPPPRILVLDDEEAICALVASSLSVLGFEVIEATDAYEAIALCEDALETERPFRLVISDLSLPGDLNGKEAVARMRQLDPTLRAIVSSGYDNDPIMHHYYEHGFAGALAKPYELGTLNRLVGQLLAADTTPRKTA